jgi:hypothetical protein
LQLPEELSFKTDPGGNHSPADQEVSP